MQVKRTLGIIGCGNMGTALIRGVIKSDLYRIMAAGPDAEKLQEIKSVFGVDVTTDNRELSKECDIILLAVKPQTLEKVLMEIKEEVSGKLIISIAAGVSTSYIESILPKGVSVIRAMPNVAAMVGEAATALTMGKSARQEHYETARGIFECVGTVMKMEEDLMDAVTGLSGTGPMYIFLMVEALSDAGVKMGLSRKKADILVAQTLYGTSKMVKELGKHPAALADLVTSPGGTAITALHALEKSGFKAALMEAVEVATERARELGAKYSAEYSK
jgi:pyrroline-5-carboxylate reductase